MKRREFCGRILGASAALTARSGWSRSAGPPGNSRPRVVVVGGGCGGATAAKYLRLLSEHAIEVWLIEPQPRYVSSPLSNRVIDGSLELADLTRSYDSLVGRHGVRWLRERAVAIDPTARRVRLSGGVTLPYDKLVLSPGIDVMTGAIEGLEAARAQGRILQSWSAGRETVQLNRQLMAMRDGGVFAITIPEAPFRCPPAPYERASLVAAFCRRYKPKSKVLVLDANADVVAMGSLFKPAWRELYGDVLEYRNHHQVVAVDARTLTVRFDVQEDVRADVLNVLAPVRAGVVAQQAGLANVNARWCAVAFPSFESTALPHVHVIGDSVQGAPMMPKSGHMANGQAKVAAAAIVASLLGRPVEAPPVMSNACYSFVSPQAAMHSCAVYAYVSEAATFKLVPGAGGHSDSASPLEAVYAMAWARNFWNDMLG